MNTYKINQRLSNALLITCTGDFLAIFAYAVLFNNINGDPLYAGLVLPIKGVAVAVASILFPLILTKIGNRNLLVWTQVLLGFSATLVALLWATSNLNSNIILILLYFLESLLAQLFTAGREAFSKGLEEESTEIIDPHLQRKLQTQNEIGFLTGQFGGPLLFFILIQTLGLPLSIALALNAITFFIAAVFCLKLPNINYTTEPMNILMPLKYLHKNKKLLLIFFIRGFFLWVTLGLFNLLLFPIVAKNYNLDISYSTIVYSTIGAGAILGLHLINSRKYKYLTFFNRFSAISDTKMAIIGNLTYAFSIILFSFSSNKVLGLLSCLLVGVANGFQKVSTRSIMRKETSAKTYVEVLSLEFLLGKITDVSVTVLFFYSVKNGITNEQGVYFAALWLILFAPLFMFFREKQSGLITKN